MTHEPLVILQADRHLGETRAFRGELRRRGAVVLMTDFAEEAVQMAKERPPDLIILDDDLSAGGYCDLPECLRSAFPAAEIILLSSKPLGAVHGIGMGLLFHGLRPVATRTLIELIESAFPGRLADAALRPEKLRRVICVDDDRGTLNALSRFLGRHGYRVDAFEDPRKVLSALAEIDPDVAILDMVMPGLDGRELSRLIRDRYPDQLPVVLHSAWASKSDCVSGPHPVANYFLPKPCDPDRLLDVIDYYAGRIDAEERRFLETRL